MSRGGRGGSRGGGGMKAHALPFEVDDELDAVLQRGYIDQPRSDVAKEVFPEFGEPIIAAPVTEVERALVQIERDMDVQRRAGPFWTGTKDQWAQYDAQNGRTVEGLNPFEDAGTYSQKHKKRAWQPADLSRIKIDKRFFPKELWDVIDKDQPTDANGRPAKPQRTLGLVKKAFLDKLAKLEEGDEDANAGSEDGDDVGEIDEEGEDITQAPGDDVFEEDDDDFGGDYDAEHYFDAGDEDYDDGGGDEATY